MTVALVTMVPVIFPWSWRRNGISTLPHISCAEGRTKWGGPKGRNCSGNAQIYHYAQDLAGIGADFVSLFEHVRRTESG
jgi:hypothetical protein